MELIRPITSSYRRKDGNRRRTYRCRHVHDGTGLCDAPEIDAELVDAHVVNELQRYLGDFEAWREQLVAGYGRDRDRLEREAAQARVEITEADRRRERSERAVGRAEDEAQERAAMRGAAHWAADAEQARTRLRAAEQALAEVPTEAPADAMLDFYNELGKAIRGRLAGADTLARVNDALRDVFSGFVLRTQEHGVQVLPILGGVPTAGEPTFVDWIAYWSSGPEGSLAGVGEEITPPLRALHAPARNRPTRRRRGTPRSESAPCMGVGAEGATPADRVSPASSARWSRDGPGRREAKSGLDRTYSSDLGLRQAALGFAASMASEAAKESNLPSVGLRRPAGFEGACRDPHC